MASVCGRYNASSDWLSAAKRLATVTEITQDSPSKNVFSKCYSLKGAQIYSVICSERHE